MTPPRPRRRWIAVLALVLAAASVTTATYGLLLPPEPTTTTHPTVTPHPAATETGTASGGTDPGEGFARRIALALFRWDTATMSGPSIVEERVLAHADSSDADASGLVADVAGYLPDPAQWTTLSRYHTRQWLTLTTITIPATWPQVERSARGRLPVGAVAFTIVGIRHRAGIWNGHHVTARSTVTFTIFATCTTAPPSCRLARLSTLGTPLP